MLALYALSELDTFRRSSFRKVIMKRIFTVALAAGVALAGVAAVSPADAAGGCGRGFHPGPRGHCRPNGGGPGVVAGPALGVFYAGRGDLDGHAYPQHRERFHGRWRSRQP